MSVALLCVGALTAAGWVPIRERCRAPFDGVLWTLHADAERELQLDDALHDGEACDAALDPCVEALALAEPALLSCRFALDEARAELAAPPVVVDAGGPAWLWTAASLAAPWLGWGACTLGGVDGATWCGVGAGAATLGVSLLVDW